MTTPKSATEIMAEFNARQFVDGAHTEDEHNWLRAALASHTAYLLGKMPKKKDYCRCMCRENEDKHKYNAAIDETRAILESEITELTK